MENLSNNNRVPKRSNLYRLLLLFVFSCSFFRGEAQPYFNRLYTNSATGSIFQAVCPQGNGGGFMAVAYANDSIENKEGLRICRLDAEGNLLQSNFFYPPDYATIMMSPSKGGMVRVNDNCFALCGVISKSGCCQYGYMALADSNGKVYRYQNLLLEFSPNHDSFMWVAQVKYDGTPLIVLSHYFTTDATSSMQVLTKYDTALNRTWAKTYGEGANPSRLVYSLHADSNGYVMGGVSDNGSAAFYTKMMRSETFVTRTDTSGKVQWRYKSPTLAGAATDLVRTADGGYVYSTMGNVVNVWPIKTDSRAEWRAQHLLVKLDAYGVWQWEQVYDYDPSYSSNFGVTTIRLLAAEGGGFRTLRSWADSPYVFGDSVFADIRLYNTLGALIKSHKSPVPTNAPMKGKGALNDMQYTSDKSIVVAGYYEGDLTPDPAQRGWLLKVDSNGCMGATDPQCWAVSVPSVPLGDVGYRVYPNPSNGALIIRSWGAAQATATVYDVLGRMVYRSALSFANKECSIHLNVINGSYIVELQDKEGNVWREKVQVQ